MYSGSLPRSHLREDQECERRFWTMEACSGFGEEQRRRETREGGGEGVYRKRRDASGKPRSASGSRHYGQVLSPLNFSSLSMEIREEEDVHSKSSSSSLSSAIPTPRPDTSHYDRLFTALLKAYKDYQRYLAAEGEKLRCEAADDSLVRSNTQTSSHCSAAAQQLGRLYDKHTAFLHSALKVRSTSLTDIRLSAVSGATKNREAEIARDLRSFIGQIFVEVKVVAGFARVRPGDVFEVQLRHGDQKWKTKGKTTEDKTQRWQQPSAVIRLVPDAPLNIKVLEVSLLRSKVLSESAFQPWQLISFSASSQLLTLSLNSSGSLKLQLAVTWQPPLPSPLASTLPHPSRSAASSLSSASSASLAAGGTAAEAAAATSFPRRPRVVLREKKREAAARQALKEQWRSSTNILDELYSDISSAIPSVDAMSCGRSSYCSSGRSPSATSRRRSVSLAYLCREASEFAGNAKGGGASGEGGSSADSPSHRLLPPLITRASRLLASLSPSPPFAFSLQRALGHWETVLGLSESSSCTSSQSVSASSSSSATSPGRPLSRVDELDDNVLAAASSEDDSGVDSLRGRRFGTGSSASRAGRHSSLSQPLPSPPLPGDGVLDEELATSLHYHLSRVVNALQAQSEIGPGQPLHFRATQLQRLLDAETATLLHSLPLASLASAPNLSNLLSELSEDADVHELWLGAALPARRRLLLPRSMLASSLICRLSSFGEKNAARVAEALLRLLDDEAAEKQTPSIVSLFHFAGLFQRSSFLAVAEHLSHQLWMESLLSSGEASSVAEVVARLRRIPLAPPLDTLRLLSRILATRNPTVFRIVEEYLCLSTGQLRLDLVSSFVCLLETADDYTRIGAIAALAILKNDDSLSRGRRSHFSSPSRVSPPTRDIVYRLGGVAGPQTAIEMTRI